MTEARPTVSVIIIVRNGADTIRAQLDALANQRGAAPVFEVVIADNGSTDSTADIVREWIAEGPKAHTTARLIDASRKKGIPFARNAGALASRGEILAFCDADDVVADDWVAEISGGLTSLGMVGGRTLAYTQGGEFRADASVTGPVATHYLPYLPTGNMAVSREVLFGVGGFDESLPHYGFEDVDFAWRVQLAGYSMTFVPSAIIRFHLSGSVTSVRKVWSLSMGRMAMIQRHPSFATYQYSLRSTMKEALLTTARLPRRLVRPAGRRSTEVRQLVSAYGRAVGYWKYHVLGRAKEPRFIEPDPFGAGTSGGSPPQDREP